MLKLILAQQLYDRNGWRITDLRRDDDDNIQARVVPTRRLAFCSGCGGARRKPWDTKPERRWRHLDGWGLRTFVVAQIRRVRCPSCGVRVEKVPWARPYSRFTLRFEAEILDRARETSIQGVCRQLGVHWTTVMRLLERWVADSAAKRFRRPLRRIGVDEVSYGRGQRKYLTVVWDHDAGQVVWIGKGRERETLEAFFAKLGKIRASRLRCVTMDMAQGFISAVRTRAPQADIVFDRFHIERHLTEAVNEVRKQEFWRHGGRRRDIIRGKKFLLLKKRRRLHWRRRRELDELLALNQRLNMAYILKEQFDLVWTARTEMRMLVMLGLWRSMFGWIRLEPLARFWEMILRHIDGVLAWAKHRLTNAPLEGNNARVRAISHRARGYRNPDNFIVILFHASWRRPASRHPNAR